MPRLRNLDLIVRNVPVAAAFFRDIVGLEVLQLFDRFAELDAGGTHLLLSPDALVPIEPARGVILHFEVDDVEASEARALSAGTVILKSRFVTDWGTESTLIQGPEGVIVDLYRAV